MPDSLLQALTACLGLERCITGVTERLIYARDLWPLHTLRLRHGELPKGPEIIVFPQSEAEVAEVVRLARRFATPITPYGGGSGVLGGAMALHGGILMDLKHMSRVLSLDAVSGTAVVEPGILGQHLEDRLNERGFTLGHFPSSLMTASMGGYVATRSAGQFSSRYGKIEDMVVSMRFVAGSGEVFDTARDSLQAGIPDYNQILLGSEGTLGIITQVTVKVQPLAPVTAYRGVRFTTLEAGLSAMRQIMQAGLRPSVLRLYDELDTWLVGRGHVPPQPPRRQDLADAQAKSGSSQTGPRRHPLSSLQRCSQQTARGLKRRLETGLVQAGLSHSDWLEKLVARAVPSELLLILGFEGEKEEVDASLPLALSLCQAAGGVDEGEEPGLQWLRKRYDVSFKMPQFFNLGAFVDTIEVAAAWDRIPGLYRAIRRAASPHVLIMAHFSHAYSDGVSIYGSIGGSAGQGAEARYHGAWKAALDTVRAHGGTVSHHHGVGRMKAAYVTEEQAGFVSLFAPLKVRLDPDGLLNPGVLYGKGPGATA